MTAVLACLCLAVVAASLLGGLLPLASVLTHTRLQLYLSFAAGAMLGAAFFHMMPEAVRQGVQLDAELVGGGPALALLPGAVLRLPPPRGPGRPAGALPDPPPRARPRPGPFGRAGRRLGPGRPGDVDQGDVAPLGGGGVRPGPAHPDRRGRPGRRGEGRRGPGRRRPGSVRGHPGPQAGRRPDDRQPDAPGRRLPTSGPTWSTSGFRLMIPLGAPIFWLGVGLLGKLVGGPGHGQYARLSRPGPSSASR